MLPDGLSAEVHRTAWTVPPIFRFLQREGQVPDGDMWRTFNMGIGLVVACRTEDREEVTSRLAGAGETPVVIGELIPGERRVIYR
jgi:phosphoribosylformylglycinamidine cyclo-ligase